MQRCKEISLHRREIEKRLDKYPNGKIHIIQSRRRIQFYLRTEPSDRSGKYISKKNISTIKTFLQKKYDEQALNILLEEEKNLKQFLNTIQQSKSIRDIYSNNPKEIKEKLNPNDMSDADYAEQWQNWEYIPKSIDPNKVTFVTNKGETVRSKSELNIANMLDRKKIPYRYECPVRMSNGDILHPDFTVLNVKTRKEYIWEHRGMMDDRGYAEDTVQRIKKLNRNGYLLGKNMIITEETGRSPLGTEEIIRVIENFLI